MSQNHALTGIKVASFAWAGVGPRTVKYLADEGAEVIRIESHLRPCVIRLMGPYKDDVPGINRGSWWAQLNSSSLSVSLNLGNPSGRELARKLAVRADVVVESFTPGTMKKWDLDYEGIRKLRPDTICVSTCQMGQTGPLASFGGYGWHAASIAGFYEISGWPDRGPSPPQGAYTDSTAPRFLASAILAALDYKRRTGRGQYIDQSQFESAMHFLAPPIIDYMVNGRIMGRNGNRLPYAAPHGVYRCQGDDRWCAIAVMDEALWKAFCRGTSDQPWQREERFSSLEARKQNEDELDRLVEAWTIRHTPEEVETILQAVGVPAHVVETNRDLFEDPQIAHRGFLRRFDHAEIGRHAYQGVPFRLSKTPDSQGAAPCMGQHNDYVFRELLGMSRSDMEQAVAAGAFTTEKDLPKVQASI